MILFEMPLFLRINHAPIGNLIKELNPAPFCAFDFILVTIDDEMKIVKVYSPTTYNQRFIRIPYSASIKHQWIE